MNQKERGLFKKYNVSRMDKKPLKNGCIVLEFGSKNTADAILQFADSVEADGYGPLARELREKLNYFKPGAQKARDEKKRAPQAIIDSLKQEIAEEAKYFRKEIARISSLLLESHALTGRLVHQMDAVGLHPTSARTWNRQQQIENGCAEAPSKQGSN